MLLAHARRTMVSETQQSTSTQSTEQRTQSTQQASQQEYVVDTTCWGSLISCNPKVPGYKFEKAVLEYRIGRKAGPAIEIVLPAPKISQLSQSQYSFLRRISTCG